MAGAKPLFSGLNRRVQQLWRLDPEGIPLRGVAQDLKFLF